MNVCKIILFFLIKKEKSKFLLSSFPEYMIHRALVQNPCVESLRVLKNNIGDKDLSCNGYQQ